MLLNVVLVGESTKNNFRVFSSINWSLEALDEIYYTSGAVWSFWLLHRLVFLSNSSFFSHIVFDSSQSVYGFKQQTNVVFGF